MDQFNALFNGRNGKCEVANEIVHGGCINVRVWFIEQSINFSDSADMILELLHESLSHSILSTIPPQFQFQNDRNGK